ncbi:MAG: LicD family protein [Clostridiales Family XIII bacterium]|nr:LicD family protein [Clostridiales Family XIII bacterium]
MDSDFFDEEVRSGYTVTRDIKKLWSVQLGLLERFTEVCGAYDLEYFAMFGTMLGAVRHGGFIPWDDDIDVAMPRGDYDRLSRMTDVFDAPLFLQTPENDPAAVPRFMKLMNGGTTRFPPDFPSSLTKGGHMGCCIDILPLDHAPSGRAARKTARMAARCQRLRIKSAALLEMGLREMPRWKRRHCRMTIPRSYEELTERYREICARYSANAAGTGYYMMPVLAGDRSRLFFEKSLFSRCVTLDFEHLKVRVPCGYERLAELIWEEGSELPDIAEREPKHKGFIDTGTPYTAHLARYEDVFKGLEGKDVLLFGAGNMLNIYMRRYGSRFPPKCAFDNDKGKWGKTLCGVPILNPKSILDIKGAGARLIIISLYHREIGEQLERMGIYDYYIFVDGWNY